MSIIYHFSAKPLAGKRSSTISIIRTSAGILARLGASQTRVYHNMLGGSLGNIGLGCTFDSFSEAMNVLATRESDPHWLELLEKQKPELIMDVQTRSLLRVAYGEADMSAVVHHVRSYSMMRDKLPQALEMFNELEDLGDEKTKIAAVVPSVSAGMAALHAVYQNDSLEDAGNSMDKVGMSEAFQNLILRASQLGTLGTSSINVKI